MSEQFTQPEKINENDRVLVCKINGVINYYIIPELAKFGEEVCKVIGNTKSYSINGEIIDLNPVSIEQAELYYPGLALAIQALLSTYYLPINPVLLPNSRERE